MFKKKHSFFANDNVSIVFPSKAVQIKSKLFKVLIISRKLFSSVFKGFIFHAISDFSVSCFFVLSVVFRDISAFSLSSLHKKRIIRRYGRRPAKQEVSLSLISISAEQSESDEKYFPRYPSRDMDKVKKPLSRRSKIVIFKKNGVRRCFKRMRLVFESKFFFKKASVVFFIISLVFQRTAKSFFKKKAYEFEKKSKK